jgi:DNA-3-methyladenine glycosylase II
VRPQAVRPLTEPALVRATGWLADADPVLGASVERFGPPPLWSREPTFSTLVHLILEQQVSLASARAAFGRLIAELGDVTPPALLSLGDERLRTIGFSRQKVRYARALATALLDGFDLSSLGCLADDEARMELMRHPGIGRWTADVYLTMCLLRPDVWTHGDQALRTAAVELLGLKTSPSFTALEVLAERWRPYRAVGARILWHHYLRVRGSPVD